MLNWCWCQIEKCWIALGVKMKSVEMKKCWNEKVSKWTSGEMTLVLKWKVLKCTVLKWMVSKWSVLKCRSTYNLQYTVQGNAAISDKRVFFLLKDPKNFRMFWPAMTSRIPKVNIKKWTIVVESPKFQVFLNSIIFLSK